MITRKRLGLAGVVAAAAIGGAAVLTSLASAGGEGGVFDDGKELLPQAQITVAEAIAAAQASAEGGIGEIDLEYWQGTLVFNVDVGKQDVKVDAITGEVLGAEPEE